MRWLRQAWRPVVVAWALFGSAAVPAAFGTPSAEFDFGPLASRLRGLDGRMHLRILGPLFERVTTPGCADNDLYLRPFRVRTEDRAAGWTRCECVWPLLYIRRAGDRRDWAAIVAWGRDNNIRDPRSHWSLAVFPFWFQGRDARGRAYAGLFPIYGRLHEVLGRDDLDFVLFPLWMKSSVNGVVTRDWLFPIVSETRGKGIFRFRVFPFFGRARNRDTFEKKFVLWPFFTSARYDYPTSYGSGYVVFPLWGRLDLSDQQAWMILPPFFRHTRSERLNSWLAPWPIVQIERGQSDKFYLWPLFGYNRSAELERAFLLWPVGWREKLVRDDTVRRRTLVLPFLYHQTVRTRATPARPEIVRDRAFRLWPLFSYDRRGAERRWRFPELWPIRDMGPVERGWAPFWSLARGISGAAGRDTDILWGLVRVLRHADGACRTTVFPLWTSWSGPRAGAAPPDGGWSVLGGLLGRERQGETARWRLFYVFRWRTGGAS